MSSLPATPSKVGTAADPVIGFVCLFALWWVGDALSGLLRLPLPGVVLGMLLLLLLGVLKRGMPHQVEQASFRLLSYLALFFVPPGVGLIIYGDLLAKYGFAMMACLLLSTALTIAVTGLVLSRLLKSGAHEV